MDYEKFCKLLENELPLNRKERFFTGTILPALLFHNGFENLFTFLSLIKGFPKDVNLLSTGDNFLFYTEYNLRESAGSRNIGIRIDASFGDTPDIIIEIIQPRKVFIIIEAKMFHKVSKDDLMKQINRQKEYIGRPISNQFSLNQESIFFIALLPKKLRIDSCMDFQVIKWEDIIDCLPGIKKNLFYNYLKYALDNYENLVSISSFGHATTVEYKMKGYEILQNMECLHEHWIGRKGGEPVFAEDIKTGKWKGFEYSINSVQPEKGRFCNWISVQRFFDLTEQYSDLVK